MLPFMVTIPVTIEEMSIAVDPRDTRPLFVSGNEMDDHSSVRFLILSVYVGHGP